MANAKSKKRRKILVFLVLVVVLAGLAALAVFKRREPVIAIQTEKVAPRSLTEVVVANGRIQPVFQVKISPEVSGEIIALPVKEGQQVKKGDLLLKIKPDVYLAQRVSAEANAKAAVAGKVTAKASLAKAEAEFRRIESLFQNRLVSESDFVSARTAHEIAEAQVESATHQVAMAEAALRRNEEDLAKTTIASPLDGTVSRLNSQLGERVVGTAMMAGTEVMTVADLDAMEARVDIGEMDVVLIQIGQTARLEVDAFKDRKFAGSVTEIANSAKGLGMGGGGGSQDATKYEVKIRIKDKEAFRPGMSVTAEIETRYRTNVLTVPIASVTTRLPKPPEEQKQGGKDKTETNTVAQAAGKPSDAATNAAPPSASHTGGTNGTNQTTNAVVKKPGEKPKPIEVVFLKDADRVKMVPVKRGISDDAYTEILEGVTEGQEVVSGGYKAISKELEDGKKVRIGTSPADKEKEKEPSKK